MLYYAITLASFIHCHMKEISVGTFWSRPGAISFNNRSLKKLQLRFLLCLLDNQSANFGCM